MDPNANFCERIAIAKRMAFATATTLSADGKSGGTGSVLMFGTDADRDRFHELTDAYASWRAIGGFVADKDLRSELLALGPFHNA